MFTRCEKEDLEEFVFDEGTDVVAISDLVDAADEGIETVQYSLVLPQVIENNTQYMRVNYDKVHLISN